MLSSFVDLQGIAIEVAFDIFIYVKKSYLSRFEKEGVGTDSPKLINLFDRQNSM